MTPHHGPPVRPPLLQEGALEQCREFCSLEGVRIPLPPSLRVLLAWAHILGWHVPHSLLHKRHRDTCIFLSCQSFSFPPGIHSHSRLVAWSSLFPFSRLLDASSSGPSSGPCSSRSTRADSRPSPFGAGPSFVLVCYTHPCPHSHAQRDVIYSFPISPLSRCLCPCP